MYQFMVSLLVVAGLVLGAAPQALAQIQRPAGEVDRDDAKARAQDRSRNRTGDAKVDRANTDAKSRPNETAVDDDDDDGGNAGAVAGGIAAAAVIGKLATRGKGGDKHAAGPQGATRQAAPGQQADRQVQIDANNDGMFTQDEVKQALSGAYKTADSNSDGRITREEAVAAFGEQGGTYFDALDSEKTGAVAMDTLDADIAQAFEWADANGDGSISAEERGAADQEQQEVEQEAKKNPAQAKKKLAKKARRAL
jgi:hypothetical protein